MSTMDGRRFGVFSSSPERITLIIRGGVLLHGPLAVSVCSPYVSCTINVTGSDDAASRLKKKHIHSL